MRNSRRVACAARAKAASTAAASPRRNTKDSFPGTRPGQTSGAPGRAASPTSVTAGSGSYSTAIASAASWPAARVSATTAATGSPT